MSNDSHEEQKRLEAHEAQPSHRLSDGRSEVGDAFADPNSLDDAKLGTAFEATQSSAKKHHRPVKEVVAEPFKKPGPGRFCIG